MAATTLSQSKINEIAELLGHNPAKVLSIHLTSEKVIVITERGSILDRHAHKVVKA